MKKKHYSMTEIERYFIGDLPLVEKLMIGRHIKACAECAKRLQCIKENAGLIKNIRLALDEQLPDISPDIYDKLRNEFEKGAQGGDNE